MEYDYRKLEISKDATLEDIKKAYLKKVREFPPEENPEQFIKIRKSYEDIVTNMNKNKAEAKLIKEYFKFMKLSINNNDNKAFNDYCNKVKEVMAISNFKFISDELVDLILYSKKSGNEEVTIVLTEIFLDDFKKLGLIKLSDKYLCLKNVLKEGFNKNGY